jgi:tripartite ATP-independent transporter DctM subunit
MNPTVLGLLGILLFVVFVILKMPITYAMFLIGFIGVALMTSINTAFNMVSMDIYTNFSSYTLVVVPMFIWMGYLAYYSGLGTKLFNFADKMIGHFHGGIAFATQLSCALFGAICGSLPATTATIGSIAIPEMRRYKYDMGLAAASIASGGVIGVLIPPSVVFIVYGIATEQSIGTLFKAGIIPGILLTLANIAVIAIKAKINPKVAPAAKKSTWKERLKSMSGGLWETAVIFALAIGGLFAGWFTPSESGAIGAGGVLVITILNRTLSWEGFKKSLRDTTNTTAMIMFMIVGATALGRFLAITRLPFVIAEWSGNLPFPPFVIMLIILLIYLIMGCFIEALALILLTIPIFYPVVVDKLGYDPIWFGVIMVMVVGMGVITPPVGMNVYIIKNIAKDTPIEDIFKNIFSFLLALIVVVLILLTFPQIVTFVI